MALTKMQLSDRKDGNNLTGYRFVIWLKLRSPAIGDKRCPQRVSLILRIGRPKRTMKTKIILLALVVASSFLATTDVVAQSGAVVRYHVVTAPTSADNNSCLQNVMSFVDKGGIVGLIPTDISTSPCALNMPNVLRASEIIYGPVGMKIWDGVTDPVAPAAFTNQNGQRLAWSLDYTNREPFLASDMYFALWSSDPANTLRFRGNVATNGTTALWFSPTLRGELWDSNGNKIATYYNGESIADHPINRLIVLIRLGYYVTDASQVQLDLTYFRNQMPMTQSVAFYRQSGWGVTNSVSSNPHLTAHRANTNGDQIVTLEGQRRLGLKYGIRQTPSLDPGHVVWTDIASGLTDGGSVTNTLPMAFYRAFENGFESGSPHAKSSVPTTSLPVLKVTVGPDENQE